MSAWPPPDNTLAHVGQVFLQIAETGSYDDKIGGNQFLEVTENIDLSGHINQGIVSRLIPIGWRVGRRPLDVRRVVGLPAEVLRILMPSW